MLEKMFTEDVHTHAVPMVELTSLGCLSRYRASKPGEGLSVEARFARVMRLKTWNDDLQIMKVR